MASLVRVDVPELANALLIAGGGFLAVLVLGALVRPKAPRLLTLNPRIGPDGPDEAPPFVPVTPTVPSSPVQPPPPPTGPVGPIELGQDPLPVEPGARYIVSVVVSGALSLLATRAKVAREAEKEGFRDVSVTTSPPPNRPPLAHGDYYVEATFAGAPTTMERSHAGGRVEIVDAWRLT